GPMPGVRAPVRLTGRLHGVWFHSSLPADERQHSLFEVLDARLALALDDFAAVLERHDIDEVVHFTMYRPNGAAPEHGVQDEPAEAARHPAAPAPARATRRGHGQAAPHARTVARRAPPAAKSGRAVAGRTAGAASRPGAGAANGHAAASAPAPARALS